MSGPTCSYLPREGLATGPPGAHGVVPRDCVRPDDTELCGQPATYTVTSRYAEEADLCAAHTAHARACPECRRWLAEVRTVGR